MIYSDGVEALTYQLASGYKELTLKPYRSRLLAIAASLSIHVLVLLLYSPIARIMPGSREVDQPAARAVQPMVFDLVETPDDALRGRPENATHVSNKDALARNEVRPEDLPRGEAYSEGISDYSTFRGESGNDAMRASEADRQLSGEDRPMENPDDMVIRVPIDLGQVFSRNRASSMRSPVPAEYLAEVDRYADHHVVRILHRPVLSPVLPVGPGGLRGVASRFPPEHAVIAYALAVGFPARQVFHRRRRPRPQVLGG